MITILLLFFILSVFIIIWFIIYILTIFGKYKENLENNLEDTLKNIKDPDIFKQLKDGNIVSRITINGYIDINVLKKKVENQQRLVDDLEKEINESDFDKQINDIRKKAILLKNENDALNDELTSIENEFDRIVNTATTNKNGILLLKIKSRFNPDTNKKSLLDYIYSDIDDPFNIISGN
jgi:peptidoglycan hydrolase CwlO-like protein